MENQRKSNYDIIITNITDELACLGIAGYRSRDVLSKMTTTDLSDESFPYLVYRDVELTGIPVRAIRFSLTGTLIVRIVSISDSLLKKRFYHEF